MIRVNDMFNVEWKEGMTVRGVLDSLGWDYALITVSVDGEHVPPTAYDHVPVPDGAVVQAIHIAHGG